MNSALKDGACRCSSLDLRSPTFGSMTAAQPRNVQGRCGIGGASMMRATSKMTLGHIAIPAQQLKAVREAGDDHLSIKFVAADYLSEQGSPVRIPATVYVVEG